MSQVIQTRSSLARTFDARPERLFAAWTDPHLLAQWWGPPDSVVVSVEIDLRVGGRYRLGIKRSTQETHFVSGSYRVIQPPYKLIFTWRWEDPEMDIGESLVSLEFRAKGNKTELQLTHERLPTPEARLHHKDGWVGILENLDSFLEIGDRLAHSN